MLRSLASLATIAALCGGAFAQGCPIQSIATTNFDYNPDDYTTMAVGFDPSTCQLTLQMVKNPNETIGNYYLTQHYLMVGDVLLLPPIPLSLPFYGHDLLILPGDVIGPLPGGKSALTLPNDPTLVGKHFFLQGIAEFITTVHFPIEPEYVLLHGVSLTLQ